MQSSTHSAPRQAGSAVAALGAALALSWAAGAGIALAAPAASSPMHAPAKAHPVAKAHPAALPVGAATGFPFGYTMDEGTKISLLPANDSLVDQARVAHTPRLGPWKVNLAAGVKAWPNACNLTNATQLHDLFPGITGLQGKPLGNKGEELGSGASTPNNVECKFNLKTTFEPSGYPPSWAQVNIEEVDSGAPSNYAQSLAQQKSSAKKFPAQYADYPNLSHGVKCFDDGNELQCLKDDFNYWISGQKVTDGSNTSVDQAVWIDQVEIPLAELLGAELSTTP